ncbi:MAG: hypothetical protein ING71_00550 [Rhodocyclaceae bacterium]|nr:hypothetical protein [Rhodocyclaceae bacterium]MCA3025800.1 hypothetical protein [Rhodocyclaceae bacterium]MCA3032595.1 hypothetical protein [Rhodocyclaceae bacterium]MCA3048650.1 hypothetical protein [Rhodocyclaceae bacterium]MCA3056791.1 hypothetical protein [Rhodocyclaceae bacterium]
MSWDQYKSVAHPTPYVLKFKTARGDLLYFGAAHSNDPLHPQFATISACWEKLKPTTVLLEGGVPQTANDASQAIARNGEAGFVGFLAAKSGAKVSALERGIDAQAAMLEKKFTKVELKLFYTLRQLQQVKREKNPAIGSDWDGWANWWLGPNGFFNFVPSLKNSPPFNVEELKSLTKIHFPSLREWHDIDDSQFDPRFADSLTQRVAREASDLREPQMVQTILENLKDGRRVFAIAGASHVVVQEDLLTGTLGAPIKKYCD